MEIDLSKDIDSMKKDSLVKYVRELVAHVKSSTKKETKADEIAVEYPYEGVSVVGNKFITIKFDLETKEARVTEIDIDTRDVKTNHMASYKAIQRTKQLSSLQKEIKNEKN